MLSNTTRKKSECYLMESKKRKIVHSVDEPTSAELIEDDLLRFAFFGLDQVTKYGILLLKDATTVYVNHAFCKFTGLHRISLINKLFPLDKVFEKVRAAQTMNFKILFRISFTFELF